jgi:hypothetical protein
LCQSDSHIAIECSEFKSKYEGNIKAYFEKTKILSMKLFEFIIVYRNGPKEIAIK